MSIVQTKMLDVLEAELKNKELRYTNMQKLMSVKNNLSEELNGWISVKDRLPEGIGWVAVYGCILSRWSVQPGFYDKQSKEWVSRFMNSNEVDEGYAPFESVTHWQPLPAPPKEEE